MRETSLILHLGLQRTFEEMAEGRMSSRKEGGAIKILGKGVSSSGWETLSCLPSPGMMRNSWG